MMRSILAFIALIALLSFMGTVSRAQPQPQPAGKPQGPVGWPREVKGYGTTVEQAEKSAMEHAVQRVAMCLQSQDPPLEAWHPDADYVKKHLLKPGPGEAGEDFAIVDNGPKVKTWVLTFKESPNWADMVQLNQAEQRLVSAADRQSMAGFGLAALTALLATGWGYLRIDEWTKGRFTRWLAIGAATLLGASGAVWWMNT
jgi:hypothetical protein